MANSDVELLNLACLIDPRYFKVSFKNSCNVFKDRKEIEEKAQIYFKNNYVATNLNKSNKSVAHEKDHFTEMMEEFCENSINFIENPPLGDCDEGLEQNKYYIKDWLYVSDNFPKNTSIVDWWKMASSKYKKTSVMAKDFLAISPSSVPAERLFPSAGCFMDKLRMKTKTKNLRYCVCLKNWLDIVKELNL